MYSMDVLGYLKQTNHNVKLRAASVQRTCSVTKRVYLGVLSELRAFCIDVGNLQASPFSPRTWVWETD